MKILLTGCEGYIGSVAGPMLMERGHEVHGLDTGFFQEARFGNAGKLPFPIMRRDVRTLTSQDLEGFDAVVHMAELSNDPMGALSPDLTYAINHRGSVGLAKVSKQAGVSRFVHMSSCSVYGVATQDLVDETSPLNPQTTYAECKLRVENDVSVMADESFCPTFLRNATAFGLSPRMRFDLVLNSLCGLAQTEGEIRMFSDGSPWRPLVHIRDISKAIACVLEAPEAKVRAEKINVGDNHQNYQVRTIAALVKDTFRECEVTFGDSGGDNRSYKVNFDKIHQLLPDFSCEWDAKRSINEFKDAFDRYGLDKEAFSSRTYIRMKQLQHLVDTDQLDHDFYWKPRTGEM